MNNLLQFVIRYSAFLLFALLEIIAFFLVVRYNDDQRAIYLHSSARVSGRIYQAADDLYQYNRLSQVSDSLAAENARLKEHVFNLERSLQHYLPPGKPMDSCVLETFRLIDANIISNSVNQRNNHFLIDKGSRHGIQAGMGVITREGVAGIIDHVDPDYATGISVLHSASRISAAIARNNYFGPLVWKDIDPSHLLLEAVPRQAEVRIGDTIVTSGFSFVFPRGIFIGTVSRFWTEGGSNYYSIEVKLHEDLARMDRVYVVAQENPLSLKE